MPSSADLGIAHESFKTRSLSWENIICQTGLKGTEIIGALTTHNN